MLLSRYGTLRAILALILLATALLFAQSASKPNTQAMPESTTTGNVKMPSFKVMTHPVEHHLQRGTPFNGDVRTLPQIPPEKFERPEFEQPEIVPVPYPGTAISPQASAAPFAAGIPSISGPAPSPSITFDGLDFTNWGAGHPPDTNGDVGPLDYVQTINTSVGIYRKSDGVRLAAFTFNTLMNGHFGNLCDTNNFGDPVVVYDTFEDRWIVTDFAFTLSGGNPVAPEFQCFAVSKSGDPVAGGWNFYSIQVNGAFGDYPKFGIWPDGLYMSANDFGFGAGGSFQNVRVWAFNKAQMYAGAPTVQVLSFDAPSAEFTLLPANARLQTGTPPAGSPNYFAVVWQFLNVVSVYKFHVNWNSTSTSTFSGPFMSTTPTWWAQYSNGSSTPTTIPSPANNLDSLYPRLMVQNQYSNISGVESLWTSHTVGAGNPTSNVTSGQAAVRYYQVKVTGGTVEANATQSFTFSPDATVFRFMPSVEVDRAGDMAIGYSASDASLNPAIRYAGRLAGDPVNSITQTETSLIEGTGTQSGNCGSSTCTRWGDYSAMTLDPNGCTFWYTNMYYQTTGLAYNTRIGAFSFPSCTPSATGTLQGTVTASGSGNPISGATVALGSRTTTTAANGTYSFTGLPSGTYPSITASFPGYVSGSAANVVISDGLTTTQNFSLTLAPTSGCLTDTTQADFQAGVPTNCDLTSSPGDVILVSTASIDQQNTTVTNNGFGFTSTSWAGQTFTPAVTGKLTRADLELFCSGCTGTTPNITVSIRATTGSPAVPTGADLATATITGFSSGAGIYYTANFGSPATLTAGTIYAVIFRAVSNPSAGIYAYVCSCTTDTNPYVNGQFVTSGNSGSTWTADTTAGGRDIGFKTYMQSGFTSPGTFVSSIKDANPASGATPNWNTLSWTASTPANTAIKFQAAASNNISGPFNFVGPDGTAGTFFTNGGSLAQFNGSRYLEYQASLTTTDSTVTPTLNDVTVCFSNASPASPPTISKSFGAASIPLNGTTSLSFTINNPNAGTSLSGIGFSDTLPTGLVVATPNGLSGPCDGGTITAATGSGSISLSGATLAASTGCTFSVNVTGITPGAQNNTTGVVTATESGAGTTSNTATLTVVAPPTITKSFGAGTVPLNGTVSLTFTINNPNSGTTLNGIGFTDNLPAGLSANIASFSNNCGASFSGTTSSTIVISGGTRAAGASCTVSGNVTGTTPGSKSNTTTAITSTEGGTGATSNTAVVTVVQPPTVSEAFGAATLSDVGTTTITFTINNPNTATALTGIGFTDSPITNFLVSTPNGLTGTCISAGGGVTNAGSVTAASSTSSIALSGLGLAANSSCTFSVNVTGDNAGFHGTITNATGTITSNEGGTGTASNTASILLLLPAGFSKAFGSSSILVNTSTSLTFTISNGNSGTGFSGLAFSDSFPPGLVVATPNGLSNTCGGTATAVAGSGSVSLSGGTLASSSSCTLVVNVTGPAGGYTNTTGAITSNETGPGSTASATLTVVAPPSIVKSFFGSTVPLNGTTSLSFTITNPAANTIPLTGVAFTDTLPAGLTVPNSSASVCGGTVTLTAPSTIALTGASIAVNNQCNFSVTVTGTTTGFKNNTTGNVTSTEGGTGNTASASITVVAPPTISKSFGAARIAVTGTASLSFTINNPNTGTALTGVGFSDTLPAGLAVNTPNGLTGTCLTAGGGVTIAGSVTATSGSSSIALSGLGLAASAGCTFSVNVLGTAGGDQNNTTGNVTSNEGGSGNTASATINVIAPPTLSLAFNPTAIALNTTTSLQFTITNPAINTTDLNGVAFTDTLPTGLTVVTSSATVCGGTLSTTNPTTIHLSGATVSTSSPCVFNVTVTGAVAGNYSNTVSGAGAITSTTSGVGATGPASNTATLTVLAPPSIAKVFNPSTIALNATASLAFTITNPAANTVALTGVAFTDTLPTGLTVASSSAAVCGGTLTTTAPTGIALTGAAINTNSQCQFSVTITGAAPGQYTNTTGNVASTNGGTGNTASANLTVVAPPAITKSFNPTSIVLNANSTLSFTITNPDTFNALSGVAFTDNLPAGVVVAATPNITGSCGSGTITATAGSGIISLSGGTLTASPAVGSSCTFSVSVTGTTAGVKNNTTGAVTSTEGGTGTASNTAVLTVIAPPSIAKVFNPNVIAQNATTSLTFTITNPAANTVVLTGVAFTDTLPTGLTVASSSATICGGTLTTTAPTGIALTGAAINTNSQCQFSVTVTGATLGQYTNTTGNVTSTNGGTGNTATANLTVAAPPTISKAFGASTVPLNGSTSLSFTITNPNTFSSLSGVAFIDNLPSGVVVAATPNVTGSCGSGTITATAGSSSIGLSGGTLTASPAAGSSCTFSVNVTGTTAGVKNNTTGAVTSTEGGTGATSNTATLTVIAPPTISKAFNPTSIVLNASSTLSFTITNPNTFSTLSGVAFTDNLPAGVVVAATPNVTGSCGSGTITATAVSSTISLSGGTLTASPAVGSSCTFSVNVTGTTGGSKSNTTGNVTSTEGGTGATSNTAILTVIAPPSIAKVFNPSTIALNATTSLTFTITNPAANTVALAGVAFSDTLPTGLTVANSSAAVCGGTLTTSAPTGIVLSGATINTNSQCQFPVTVTGAAFGSYTNTTGPVTSTNGGTGNTASAGLTVVNTADIAVTLTHHPDPAAFGGNLVFVATVTNNGPNTANVTFTETFTGAQYLVSAIPSVGTCGTTEPVTCNLGSMTNGQTATVTVVVTPLQGRNITGTAKATTDITDTNVNNSTASSTARIRFKPFHF